MQKYRKKLQSIEKEGQVANATYTLLKILPNTKIERVVLIGISNFKDLIAYLCA